ncbi:hypothetical protein HHI36_011668 [Cryptolaemus montrouzieri]|uniref:Uncharacterized protein n=1 Tax=Cryptolaemus montrouzieri TaxID=559131 RepID=A0ABD2MMJ7_9CUCU
MQSSKQKDAEINSPEKIGGNRKIYRNVKAYVVEYCECSSIQGLSYLTKNISALETWWWVIVLILCISGCSFMIKEIIDKWNQSPVLVSLATNEEPIFKVPFPAVTICPETKITRQCLNYSRVLRFRKAKRDNEISQQEKDYFDYMAPLCRLENHVNSTRDEPLNDYAEFLEKCKSVDLQNGFCQYLGRNINCTEIFTPIITDDGLCYTFNMLDERNIYTETNQRKYFNHMSRNSDWSIEYGYRKQNNKSTYPRRGFRAGIHNSLVITLFTKKSDVYASCQDFSLHGLKVTLHTPSTIPRPNQISFPTGFDELVAVSVIPALSITSAEIKEYSPHKRSCYFEKERKLKYFQRYTQSNCNMECWTNFTIQECGCVHFYMPRDADTRICSPSKIKCLSDAEDSYAVSNFPKRYRPTKQPKGALDNDCDCLPSCADLSYETEISRGRWKWNDSSRPEGRYMRKYFDEYYASTIKVFYKTSHFLPIEKTELYGIVSFLSNAGGILGLFLGFSLFSVVEILYFSSIRLIENYRNFGKWLGRRNQ